MPAPEMVAGAIRNVSDEGIEQRIQHQAGRKADAHQRGRQAHHGVVKEQHEEAGQDHQNGNRHFAHAVEQLGGERQWARFRGEKRKRGDAGGAHGGAVQGQAGDVPRSGQRASSTSPEFSGTGSRKNCRMCPVSSSGCSRGPKCSPPGSSTGLQLGSALCRKSYELMKCESLP